MTYIYRCHVCENTFDSFQDLTEHKRNELSQVAQIKSSNPDWSLQQCFNYFKQAEVLGNDQIYAHPM